MWNDFKAIYTKMQEMQQSGTKAIQQQTIK